MSDRKPVHPTLAARTLVLLCPLLVIAGSAGADDLDVPSGIDRVTVFASGAEVTRTGNVTIPAGQHRLIVGNLPAGIDPARLQLSLTNSEVRLGTLQLEESHGGELVGAQERQLQAELDQLQFERQAIADRIEAANTQLQLLGSLADGSVGGQQASLAVNELTDLLQTLSSASLEARQLIREANRELAVKDREIEQKKFELSQVATRERTGQVLTVAVEADQVLATEVAVTYPVNRASWSWLDEARLNTTTGNLSLERKAAVTQGTGEDWTDVEVTITTARPNQNTRTPELGSLLVDLFEPRVVFQERRSQQAPSALLQSADEAVASGMVQNSANVVASQYLVNFEIPGRVSVAANRQPQIMPVDQRTMPVELVTRVVPELDTSAYLEARFTLTSTEPLQAGIMQFYRDGAFIGRRPVQTFQPQDEINLPYGQDERVTVEVFPEQQDSRGGGTFRRTAVEDRRVRYEITSFHDRPVDLEVLARVPIPQNEDITVAVSDEATPADQRDVEGNSGVLMWERRARPGEPVVIRHYYSIRFPEDEQLEFRNR